MHNKEFTLICTCYWKLKISYVKAWEKTCRSCQFFKYNVFFSYAYIHSITCYEKKLYDSYQDWSADVLYHKLNAILSLYCLPLSPWFLWLKCCAAVLFHPYPSEELLTTPLCSDSCCEFNLYLFKNASFHECIIPVFHSVMQSMITGLCSVPAHNTSVKKFYNTSLQILTPSIPVIKRWVCFITMRHY